MRFAAIYTPRQRHGNGVFSADRGQHAREEAVFSTFEKAKGNRIMGRRWKGVGGVGIRERARRRG